MTKRPRKQSKAQAANRAPKQASLKARARLLSLLGEQLIGNDRLAIFELVKNSYDADASKVTIELNGIDTDMPRIIVTDNGEGMSLETLTNVWLEPGNDHRQIQRLEGQRTPKFKRLPLGEKGVGRFAVHKLGENISLSTRKKGGPELSLTINWKEITAKKYLSDAKVKIFSTKPLNHFKGDAHGTRIEISDLKRKEWTRGDIRRLQRLVTAINSPFAEQGAFTTELKVNERPEWLKGMPSAKDLIDDAPWRFDFTINEKGFTWSYKFSPPSGVKIVGREVSETDSKLLLPSKPGARNKVVADSTMLRGIGSISGNLVAYDKDPKIRNLLPHLSLLSEFLENTSGVRVYRDGIRVFNYGEPQDDWLGLDLRRVNRPTERLSRNIVIGAIGLTLEGSSSLKEKTNREGFDENSFYEQFKSLVLAAVSKFELERAIDKRRLKQTVEGTREAFNIPVEKPIADLKKAIIETGLGEKLLPYVEKVEKDYNQVKELMLKTGMAGLNLAIVFHEAERGVRSLYQAIHRKYALETVELQASSLMLLFEDIAGLLRKKGSQAVRLREVVQTAARLAGKRFERHQVHVTYDLNDTDPPVSVRGSEELLLGALTNLIDNSLYWLRVRWPDLDKNEEPVRRIHIAILREPGEGVQLVIGDNGPGFSDDPETLVRPFFTRRPDGMGLGLYYSSMATQLNGGQLTFPDLADIDIPSDISGAIISFTFPEGRIEK